MAKSAKSDASGAPATKPSFDERLARLEAIVGDLERGELQLEPAIERYQEGVELLKQCHEILASYRQRVEELSADAERSLRPYSKDPDAPAARESAGEA